jgi:arsenite methyltransferase
MKEADMGCCSGGRKDAGVSRCCGGDASDDVRQTIREGYARIATSEDSCCGPTACCGTATSDAARVAKEVGYTDEELAGLPDGANMGLSCGNPTAVASLMPGEVVVDLGSGGGFDCFISARKVGPTGRVIGVDMTPDMISKARANAITFKETEGLENVEFRLGEIEHLPVENNAADIIISNCVINLSPEKQNVWNEVARVLKPGGRVCVSDIALLKELPDEVRASSAALVGCVAGAALVDETKEMVVAAGLTDIEIEQNPAYAEAATDFRDPLYQKLVASLPEGLKLSDYVVSMRLIARKPR